LSKYKKALIIGWHLWSNAIINSLIVDNVLEIVPFC